MCWSWDPEGSQWWGVGVVLVSGTSLWLEEQGQLEAGMGDLAIDPVFRLLNITMERPSCVLPTSAIIVS